jgi:anti-anti-sigma regulatory factor
VRIRCTAGNFVDAEQVQRLHQMIASLMRPETRTVELDLREVSGADCKLVAALVLAMRLARCCGVRLVVRSSPAVEKLIRLFRVERVFVGR